VDLSNAIFSRFLELEHADDIFLSVLLTQMFLQWKIAVISIIVSLAFLKVEGNERHNYLIELIPFALILSQ
jgi:hypothetical protein